MPARARAGVRAALSSALCVSLLALCVPAQAEGPQRSRGDARFEQDQALLDSRNMDRASAEFATNEALEASLQAPRASLAAGGALLTTGMTLFVLAPNPDNLEKDALRVAARIAGDGGRLQLEGVW